MWQLVILAASVYTVAAHIPVVLWHGMGDSCCDPRSMGRVMDQINEQLPGIHIVSVKIGDTAEQDQNASFFDQISRQVDLVCETLAQDPLLVNGFNAMGFSQGGLFLRAYVQRCNNPPVRNLLTFGSPHGGVAAAPGCMDDSNFKCKLMRSVIKNGVYLSWVQSRLVQAQYFKEWDNYEEYLENSIFLADINNERPVTRPEYATRLTSLQKFVMVQFNNDTMIVPKETAVYEADIVVFILQF